MWTHFKYSYLFFSIVLLTQCSWSTEETNTHSDSLGRATEDTLLSLDTVKKVPLPKEHPFGSLPKDQYYLQLYERIPMGFNFSQVVQQINGINDLKPEDNNDQLGEKGLTEATKDILFLGKKAKLECNFDKDVLYRYSIVWNESDDTKAETLLEKLTNYYSNALGEAIVVSSEEDNHYTRLVYWNLSPDYILIAYNLNTGNFTIAVQSNKPGVVR
ncbi:MAG: hypothetical protein MUE33_05755 [Cytophagaceae bacterium]|jgi:hypothetical protein|nr:hypothetical protein [Cytophagaceae bacterium]